jgi:hypothetical protein
VRPPSPEVKVKLTGLGCLLGDGCVRGQRWPDQQSFGSGLVGGRGRRKEVGRGRRGGFELVFFLLGEDIFKKSNELSGPGGMTVSTFE